MRILVFGAGGMLGHKLIQVLGETFEVCGTLRGSYDQIERFGFLDTDRCLAGIDVFQEASIRSAITETKPDVVINAVGIVKQLESSKDVITTLTTNSIFPHRLAALSDEFGFRLICVSTDCVFDGVKGNYDENDVPNAVDLYGKSKNLGEVATGNAVTLRTSIIGRELGTAHSLVEWFLSNNGGSVKGFAGAIYTGFPTIVLAEIIRSLILDFPLLRGLYHVSSEPIDKYTLLKHIRDKFNADIEIHKDDRFKIDRSLNSTKFRTKTGFVPKTWEKMIDRMASDSTPYDQWKITNS